ncbi:MAG TPA: aldehyde dehydrogenase family protein [Thermoanaerobaculia bacterium]|nr:aldehyde dehydrogenase family protein [Thermoanaerobaculia bacterium]
MEAAREAQAVWASRPVAERLRTLRALRHLLAARSAELVAAARGAGDRSEDEILSSEVIPLADACRFLEREAELLLAPRRLGSEGRPFWLSGVEAEVRREPLGLVLVVAPSNYPLFLPGVQALQALAAGNAVLWKPGRGGSPVARRVAALAAEAGLDPRLLTVLPEDPERVRSALDAGVDKVLLTGSASTGRTVLAELASRLVPATMELSGCDALFVLPGADLDRVARAVHFGLTLNGGATCIAPRRIFAPHALADRLGERIATLLAELPAPRISLTPVSGPEEALAAAAPCPYALGASVFGPEEEAVGFASRVRAGVVVVNDVIVPTADPRLPFGGRGESGFGVTRGAEGLLELTVPKVVSIRRGRRLPHLEERHPEDAALFRAYLTLTHGGGLRARLLGLSALLAALARRGRGFGRSS